MAKVDYGAVALIPVGDYSASRQYHANELVGYQGSSYIALQNPPVGTLPTNTTYFMLHTEGTSIATASTPGTVKPDGTSTVVDASGAMSVKPSLVQAIQDTAESAAESASKIGNVPTGKTLQAQIDGLEPRVSSSEQALTVNLLNPILSSGTSSGLTYVKNNDNSYTISGTNTSENVKNLILAPIASIGFESGKTYRVLGCPSDTPAGVYMMVGSQIRENGEGANFSYPVSSGQSIFISIAAGTVIETPITIKPMITTNLSATYDDYVPYSGSSGKLDTDYKALSEKIGNVGNTDLQSQLNAATQSIAQNTTDIATNAADITALNTSLTTKIGTFETQQANRILNIIHNTNSDEIIAHDEKLDRWFPIWQQVKYYQGTWLTPAVQNLVIDSAALFGWGRLRTLCINFHFTQQTNLADGTQLFNVLSTAPVGSFFALARNGSSQMAQLALNGNKTINLWGAMQSVATAMWSVQFTYFTI